MEILKRIYHPAYEIMQPISILGRWDLSRHQHLAVLTQARPKKGHVRTLYVGTATAQNPIDVRNALSESGYDPHITVVDICARPLNTVLKKSSEFSVVLADAAALPLADKSFDFITSDFLLNMGKPDVNAVIIRELSRVLVDDGVISMTVFTEENRRKNLQAFLINRFGNKHFMSNQDWLNLFKNAGFDLELISYCVDKKPLLYHSNEFTQIVATKCSLEN